MGYYINQSPSGYNLPTSGKVHAVSADPMSGFEALNAPMPFNQIPEGKALCVEADNGFFTAFAYAYSERELQDFANPNDTRPKRWCLLDKEYVERVTGYDQR